MNNNNDFGYLMVIYLDIYVSIYLDILYQC